MASIPLAFSIHNFINSVGADAGFAAIIGLAILVLLYFAHARETANLREEAALLTQRLMQAEARVAQLSRSQAAAQPAPAPAAVAARPATVASLPFAPAGVAAPALAAATHVVPLPPAVAPTPATAAAAQAAAAPARVVSPPAIEDEPAPGVPAPAPSHPFEEERPAAAPVAAPPAATVAGANGSGNGQGVADSPLPPPGRASRSGRAAGRGPLPPLREPSRSRSSIGRAVPLLVGVALLAAVVAVLLIATSGGSSNNSSRVGVRTTNAPSARRPRATTPPFSPSSVTVAVLNGTNVNQLAHHVSAKLVADGYKPGPLQTAANQTEQTTVVAYFPGAANRIAALHVATALKLKPSAVQPIDSSTQQVACGGNTACANVVVTVGADLSTL